MIPGGVETEDNMEKKYFLFKINVVQILSIS